MATDPTTRPEVLDHRLRVAGVVFAIGSAVHVIDHFRRGQGSVTDLLLALGNLALVLQVVTITLILTRHRLAPVVAVAAGFPLAIGFAAAHWLPRWSDMSDPVWRIESATWFSYLASTAEIVGALAVGLCGLAIVRDRGIESFSTRAVSPTRPA
jgi:hypothetical protein